MTPSMLTRQGLLGALGALSLLAACGDDQAKPKGPAQLVQNNTSPDMTPEPDPDDPTLRSPRYVVVTVDPARAVYGPGNLIKIAHQVFDGRGALADDQEVTWTPMAPEAASPRQNPGEWAVGQREGELTFEACAQAPGAQGQKVCGQATLLVDAGPPIIQITSPTPGQELSGEDGATIQITGTVTDTHGQPVAMVNGHQVMLDAQGGFTYTMTPTFGVNRVVVEATDGLSRTPSSAQLNVLWAPTYLPTEPTQDEAAVTLPDGLMLRLGQRFVDDRVAPATSLEGATLTEDLADILTLLLRTIDLQSLIPNPVIDSTDVKLDVTRTSLGDARLRIDITPEGLELYLRSSDLTIDTAGFLTLVDQTLSLDGTVRASVAVLAKIKIDKQAGLPFEVQITELGVAIEDASSAFGDAQANAIFTLAQSALRAQIERVLVDALTASFLDAVPALLRDALNSLEAGLAMQSFPLDTGLGSPLQIDFRGVVESLDISPLRQIGLRLSARLAAQTPPVMTSRGVALQAPLVVGAAPFFDSSRLQIAIRLSMLNGLLHQLWRGGLLNLDVGALLPDGLSNLVKSALITGRMAPVMTPPLKGEQADLELTVGQLELAADFGQDQVTYGVWMSAGLTVSVVNDQLVVAIDPTPKLETWIISSTTPRPRISAEQLRSLLLSQVWPQLTAALGQGLMLNLPVLDLSSLGAYSPALTQFTLSFAQVRPLVVRDEFLILDSTLRGVLPPLMPTP